MKVIIFNYHFVSKSLLFVNMLCYSHHEEGEIMGLRDLFFNKLNKKIAEDIGQDQPDRVENDEVEKASYSEYSYKKVAKLREKGRLYGYRVPYLQHPVNKREKARPLFVVLGVIGIILLALATALVVMITLNFTLPLFSTALGLTDWLVPREWDVFGVVALMGSLVPILIKKDRLI